MKRLIAVCSCHVYKYPQHDVGAAHKNGGSPTRAQAVRNTWYETWRQKYQDQIDFKFFLGPSDRTPQSDEVFLSARDDYYGFPDKVQKMFIWALDHGYTDVLKVDDDVFVWIDRLLRNFQSTEYKGFVLQSAHGKYTSGTAYWLNRRAMHMVVDTKWDPADWAEDRSIGKWLAEKGIYPVHDERFQCCHCADCKKKFPTDSRISSHLVDPTEMYELMEKT